MTKIYLYLLELTAIMKAILPFILENEETYLMFVEKIADIEIEITFACGQNIIDDNGKAMSKEDYIKQAKEFGKIIFRDKKK